MDKNYQYFMKLNVDSFIGEWIAICKQKVVSHGRDVKKVFQEAKQKCPSERPLLAKIPEETMII